MVGNIIYSGVEGGTININYCTFENYYNYTLLQSHLKNSTFNFTTAMHY